LQISGFYGIEIPGSRFSLNAGYRVKLFIGCSRTRFCFVLSLQKMCSPFQSTQLDSRLCIAKSPNPEVEVEEEISG
jgi:hypothetical protein